MKKRTDALERTGDAVVKTVSGHSFALTEVYQTLSSVQKFFDDRIDKLEGFSRRDNLRFFGVTNDRKVCSVAGEDGRADPRS